MSSTFSKKKNEGHSPIVKAKNILYWRNTQVHGVVAVMLQKLFHLLNFSYSDTKSLANVKRKKSPIIGKCSKRAKTDVMEGDGSHSRSSEHDSNSRNSDHESNSRNSEQGSDDTAVFTSESSTSESYDYETEIETLRHGDSESPDDTVFMAGSPFCFNTPEKSLIRDAEVANDCLKRPVKPKRVSSSGNKRKLKPSSLMAASYSDFLSVSPNGRPQTSTPILEDGFPKFAADLSAVPTTERSAANVNEPIGDKPYTPRTRRRILQELPDKYPLCKLEKLEYRKPLLGKMTILKSQVQFLQSSNND